VDAQNIGKLHIRNGSKGKYVYRRGGSLGILEGNMDASRREYF
jgi:hypothetical protein